MRVIDIVRGMLSGYGFKLVQILAVLFVVPFLLQDEIIGLDDYGRIFAILGLLSPLTLLTDGLKTSFSRSISRSLSDERWSTGQELGNAFALIASLSAILASIFFAFRIDLLGMIQVPIVRDYTLGFALAVAFVSIDSVFFILMTYLNAKGRADVVNSVMGIEVVGRNLAFVAWFATHGGSVSSYFMIFVFSASLRSLGLLAYALRRWPADFIGFWSVNLLAMGEAVRYSLSLSAESINFYVFQRFTIPLTAAFIGPAEAGMLALGVNTISNNLSQVLLNVIRPLLIPIAARIRFDKLSDVRRRLLLDLDAIYVLVAGLVTVPIIAGMPTLVGVWLGQEYVELIFPAQILVAGTTLNVAFNMRRALMVGHGLAGVIARTSLLCGGIGVFGLVGVFGIWPSWLGVSAVIALVGAISSVVGVGIGFDRSDLVPGARLERRGLRGSAALVVGILVAFGASIFAPLNFTPICLAPPAAAALTLIAAVHILTIRLPQIFKALSILKAGANRQIFEYASDVDPSRSND